MNIRASVGDSEHVDVATLSDDAFRLGAAVLMRSVGESTSSERLRFFVLDLNLRPDTLRRMERLAKELPRPAEIVFLPAQDSPVFREICGIMKRRRRSFLHACWFAKIALLDLLSKRTDRVFFLDSDVVCSLDLAEARSLQAAFPACAAMDKPITDSGWSLEYEIEGLDPLAPYFNGGVMGIDLSVWREEGLTDKALVLTEKFSGYDASALSLSERGMAAVRLHGMCFSDQAVFNVLFYKRWKILPQEWNVQSPYGYGLLEEIGRGLKVNAHLVTNPKPWQAPLSDASAFFFETLDRTPFRGWRPNPIYWGVHLKLRTWKGSLSKWITSVRGCASAVRRSSNSLAPRGSAIPPGDRGEER